jgi:hypothetical protein
LLPFIPGTIVGCKPLGIPAGVYAVKVDGVLSRGGLGGGEESFKKAVALIWTLASDWWALDSRKRFQQHVKERLAILLVAVKAPIVIFG